MRKFVTILLTLLVAASVAIASLNRGPIDLGDVCRAVVEELQGERDASEIRCHPGEGHEGRAQERRKPSEDHRIGEEEPEEAASDTCGRADLEAVLVRDGDSWIAQIEVVLKGDITLERLEAAEGES